MSSSNNVPRSLTMKTTLGKLISDFEGMEASIQLAEATLVSHGFTFTGSEVYIHLGSINDWVKHTVAGYYVWAPLKGSVIPRIVVRVRDSNGYLNAHSLEDVRKFPPAVAFGQDVERKRADDTEGGAA